MRSNSKILLNQIHSDPTGDFGIQAEDILGMLQNHTRLSRQLLFIGWR